MPKRNYAVIEPGQLTAFTALCYWISAKLTWIYLNFKFTLRIAGRENLPRGNYVCAANHTSNWDPPVMGSIIAHRISFMAKQELFSTFLGGVWLSGIGSIAVNREKLEKSTIRSAKVVLQSGWRLGIFPEGTRSKTGEMGEMKRGVAFLAKSGNAPILPMAIYRHEQHGKRYIDVKIGPLISSEGDADEVTAEVQRAVSTMLDELRIAAGN